MRHRILETISNGVQCGCVPLPPWGIFSGMAVMDDVHTTHPRRYLPAVFGVVFAGLNIVGLAEGADLAPLLAASGFVYLGAAALRRPGTAWPMFWLAFVVIAISKVLGGPDSVWVLLG